MPVQTWALARPSHRWKGSVLMVQIGSSKSRALNRAFLSIELHCPAIDPIAILLRYLYVARKRISRLFKQFFSGGYHSSSCNKNSKVHGMKRAANNPHLLQITTKD